ncbi:hypothetical protein L9F63_024756, partial [Diploptera punctata]
VESVTHVNSFLTQLIFACITVIHKCVLTALRLLILRPENQEATSSGNFTTSVQPYINPSRQPRQYVNNAYIYRPVTHAEDLIFTQGIG